MTMQYIFKVTVVMLNLEWRFSNFNYIQKLITIHNHKEPASRIYIISTQNYNYYVFVCIFPVVFPQDILEKGLEADNFAMLGLGDVVIPGIFIALLLRFDVR